MSVSRKRRTRHMVRRMDWILWYRFRGYTFGEYLELRVSPY